jgi:hypothetical protein
VTTPGPAQRIPANITRINFPQVGGLVFFRVAQRWQGDVPPVTPTAFVRGLPWSDFDMFAVSGGVSDPDGTPTDSVPVANPVSGDMLTKYRYWAPYPEARADHNGVVPGFDTYVLDEASFTEIYNHVATSRVHPLATREDALAFFKGPGLLDGQDPDLIGVGFLTNDYREIVVNPPSTTFWAYVAEGAATYHVEATPPSTIYKRDDAAVVIVNLAKLFKDVPNGPTGKKPAQVRPHGAGISWQLSASAWSPKLSSPARDFERRDFPVVDRTIPISGIPGAFNYEYHVPTFPHPDALVQNRDVGETAQRVNATITFGAGAVPPKIELALAGTVGGER